MKNIVYISSFLLFSVSCSLAESASPVGPSSFEECVAAGNRVLYTYPPRCVTKDGVSFTKEQPLIKSPLIACKDLCGDGVCQEIVCEAVGCPCAESHQSCPRDCK